MELSESPAAPADDTSTYSGGPSPVFDSPPEHSWLGGTPRLGSGIPKPGGASGCCRTGSRHPVLSWLHWRWCGLSGTPPRTSPCAIAVPRRCCRGSALPVHAYLQPVFLQHPDDPPAGELAALVGAEHLRLPTGQRLLQGRDAEVCLQRVSPNPPMDGVRTLEEG